MFPAYCVQSLLTFELKHELIGELLADKVVAFFVSEQEYTGFLSVKN
jgi:hypothetical protein